MIEPPKEKQDQGQGLLPPDFDPAYVEGAVKPYILSENFIGDTPLLPMIDLAFSKDKAVQALIWGMLYDDWVPAMEEQGLTVFFQGYEQRGEDNRRKKIYYSALTQDLYDRAFGAKVRLFFDQVLSTENAGKPIMHRYYSAYPDMYWDLHLGVRGDAVPDFVREIGQSFVAVIGHWFPTQRVVYENYMRVRELRQQLKDWVDSRVQDIIDGKTPNADKTIVYYWLKNGEMQEDFRRKDIVFECFHNFLAFSQWGHTFYRIMLRLNAQGGDGDIRAAFEEVMRGEPDAANGSAFTPLDRFAMELMRVIAPNAGSVSSLKKKQGFLGGGYSVIVQQHAEAGRNPLLWDNPDAFDVSRYEGVPTSAESDGNSARAAGLVRCPFDPKPFAVKDGRDAHVTNSAYGTVYPVVDGESQPVCDYAGYAPFGFGYRRCAGEILTINAVKDFLRQVWRDKITFTRLPDEGAEQVPVGPQTVVPDNVSFRVG